LVTFPEIVKVVYPFFSKKTKIKSVRQFRCKKTSPKKRPTSILASSSYLIRFSGEPWLWHDVGFVKISRFEREIDFGERYRRAVYFRFELLKKQS